MSKSRLIIGMTGASGAAIAVRIVEKLYETGCVETHLVISKAAEQTLAHEVGVEALRHIIDKAHFHHEPEAIGASIASGSFPTAGMIVAPCSMRTLSAVASGLADNLIVRAADVHLKERRKLVLMARETPLHLGHLRNMCAVTEMGGIIMPPVPAFYNLPQSIDDIVDQLAARAIDLLGLPVGPMAKAWEPL